MLVRKQITAALNINTLPCRFQAVIMKKISLIKNFLVCLSFCDKIKIKKNRKTKILINAEKSFDLSVKTCSIGGKKMNEAIKRKSPENSPFIKIPFGGLTSNMLRIIAVLLMPNDHIRATYMNLGDWMTYIGRMCFLLCF